MEILTATALTVNRTFCFSTLSTTNRFLTIFFPYISFPVPMCAPFILNSRHFTSRFSLFFPIDSHFCTILGKSSCFLPPAKRFLSFRSFSIRTIPCCLFPSCFFHFFSHFLSSLIFYASPNSASVFTPLKFFFQRSFLKCTA